MDMVIVVIFQPFLIQGNADSNQREDDAQHDVKNYVHQDCLLNRPAMAGWSDFLSERIIRLFEPHFNRINATWPI